MAIEPGDQNHSGSNAFALPLQAGDEVLIRARVVACALEPNENLPRRDTGIVALEVRVYDAGMGFTPPLTKLCVPPAEVVAITARRAR